MERGSFDPVGRVGFIGALEGSSAGVGMTNKRQGDEELALFADELSAYRYLEKVLWPEGPRCPRCASSAKVGKLRGGSTRIGTYKCYKCRRTFSVLNGTLMSNSHVPPHKWLQAIYLTEGGTKSVRSQHLQRILNVSFRTARSLNHRIRKAASLVTDND